ncbi:MAG: 23S rRNA (adenine(2503)-C(2))-methyltransferase RlmN, partial [Raoultibacter sp.]
MDKTDIKSFSRQELIELMVDLKQPTFRAKQLFQWLYTKNATSYDEMSNLPATLRDELSVKYPLKTAIIVDRQVSNDKTCKYVIEFHDGARVETVALPSVKDVSQNSERLAVCLSTQAGCAMRCSFCATGKEGFTRNLTSGEIIDQIMIV